MATTDPQLPTEFTIGGRVYELVPFLKEGELYVSGDVIVERAKELDADLGEEDAQFLLKHQDKIPLELRENIDLVFTAWRFPSDPRNIAYLHWNYNSWCLAWRWLGIWNEGTRLVRRIR